jgi:hypothetical protein
MKKILVSLLILLSFILISQQPNPWILNTSTRIQPIVENDEHSEFVSSDKAIVRSFKLYYKDSIYCTDSTRLTFMSGLDTMQIYSVKRMSCDILAIFNLNHSQGKWLDNYPIDKILIYNRVTDNYYTIITDDKEYFTRLFNKYNYTK